MTNTTDTPRTDAVFGEPCAPHQVIQKWEKIIEHSRQMERELTEAKAELERLKESVAELETALRENYKVLHDAWAYQRNSLLEHLDTNK